MGDASAESYEHTMNGLDALLISSAPFAAKRDGFGFKDCKERLQPGRLPGNCEVDYVGDDNGNQENSGGHSISVNVLQGLAPPDKQRGVWRPTNSKENTPYIGLKRTRFCSICWREGHKRSQANAGTVAWKVSAGHHAQGPSELLKNEF